MKILFQNRIDTFEMKGGDTIAMLGLKKYLEKIGVEVDISLELEPDLKEYDWVLIFNILRSIESYSQFKNAKKQNKKIALMPIYWETNEFETLGRNWKIRVLERLLGKNMVELLKNIKRALQNKTLLKALKYQFEKKYFDQQKEMIKYSDIVLPNSLKEREILEKDFGFFKGEIIYNGIDLEIFKEGKPDLFFKKYEVPFKKFGICVARFDERKNQLNLIKAINLEKIPFVFIGRPAIYHQSYFSYCQKLADKSLIKFLPFLPQEELVNAYQSAHFHALVSWLETPGLVNLEAGLLGCNLVISKRGPIEEYFGDYAFYCEPNDISSIRKAIREAYEKKRNYYPELPERIKNNFTWEKSALKLKKILEELN